MLGCENSSFGGAIINGSYKLITGVQSYGDWYVTHLLPLPCCALSKLNNIICNPLWRFHPARWAPVYPNASTDHKADVAVNCSTGCLFDIQSDPSEYQDLATEEPELLQVPPETSIAKHHCCTTPFLSYHAQAMLQLYQQRCDTSFEIQRYGTDESACKVRLVSHYTRKRLPSCLFVFSFPSRLRILVWRLKGIC